jgi:hypothetical protein
MEQGFKFAKIILHCNPDIGRNSMRANKQSKAVFAGIKCSEDMGMFTTGEQEPDGGLLLE